MNTLNAIHCFGGLHFANSGSLIGISIFLLLPRILIKSSFGVFSGSFGFVVSLKCCFYHAF